MVDFGVFIPSSSTLDKFPIEKEELEAYDSIHGYQSVLFDDFEYRTNSNNNETQFTAVTLRALFELTDSVTITARYKDRWIAAGVIRAVTTNMDDEE
jgi:hypothetical protein